MIKKETLMTFFWTISLFGTPYFYIPIIVYFLKINPKLAIVTSFAFALTESVCAIMKYAYPKPRPIPMPNKTFIQKYSAGSFPSVHTARITAFSIAIASAYANEMLNLIALLVIIGVSYSRIYLRKHYFIDVIAGFLIGAVISILVLSMQDEIFNYLILLTMPFA